MKEVNNEELLLVTGGAVTATLLNSVIRAVTALYVIGQSVGASFRRLKTGKLC